MSDVRILVAEDDYIIAKELTLILEGLGFGVLEVLDSGEKILERLSTEKPDLILLDIHLAGQLTGIQTAEAIRKKYNVPFLFLTALSDVQTLNQAKLTEPYAYLVKPVRKEELFSAIEISLYNASRRTTATTVAPSLKSGLKITDSIFVRSKKRLEKIRLTDILWVEASDIYVTVVTEKNRYLLSQSMKNVEERFPMEQFWRVHRSYIVQIDKIQALEEDSLIVENQAIPIGKTYREGLMKRLQFL
jgi:DNA-binding LytR/AlgR family response regulator